MHVGLPVRVGGLVVHQAAAYGDANGVTDVPCQIADEVADLAGPYVEAEKILLDYVRAPGPKTVAGLVAARAEFQAAVAALRRQIGR